MPFDIYLSFLISSPNHQSATPYSPPKPLQPAAGHPWSWLSLCDLLHHPASLSQQTVTFLYRPADPLHGCHCPVARSHLTLCSPMNCSMAGFLSFTISQSLLKLMSIELVMSSNHLILCHPLLLLPSIFPSIGVFSNESALLIRWPKYWTFSFSINPSDGYSGLISFRIDWFYLLAVQGTLKSLLPHYSLKASILQHSAFFMLQLSYLYMINGKTIALTIWSSVF